MKVCARQPTTVHSTQRFLLDCFLTSIFAFFGLLSSRILQSNLLDLYLVEIRRYKLSFFVKAAKNQWRIRSPYFQVFQSLKRDGGWNSAHNWLNLLTSCGPNLEGIGRNVIFCELKLKQNTAKHIKFPPYYSSPSFPSQHFAMASSCHLSKTQIKKQQWQIT